MAFDTKVTVVSTSLNKKDEAIECLGADSFLVSRDPDQMQGEERAESSVAIANVATVEAEVDASRHEIVGVVAEVGREVDKVKVRENVGVGVLVGSCRKCDSCTNDLEQYCASHIGTYSTTYYDGTTTYEGYSDLMVADEHFIFRWPENLPMEAAPLLCAGINTYSPLKYFGLDKPGMHIGVVGLGGLGHMAVKFAKAFGCNVTH
ncbi:hypothetical protein RND71_025304 [Anisodus tanguticus]|uniref:Alcohol dehydrogenase-like N-terminal domain-containing protein n=1 Tax=Anisodus tanguticus TaxID=243964 RepID=A0AAE1V4Q3_9SOLA|nr:hypothetical protein RND71_025304 [Anisodus tanguticus]